MHALHAPRRFVIATRESALALWQAEHVRARLTATYPSSLVELLGVTTQGDRVIDRPLAALGGKGLFIKELEVAMNEGRADLAVHSLKDVPMEMAEGFVLAAITVVILITMVTLLAAGPLMRLVGEKVEAMITRILGVILAALAAQFIVDGLKQSFPSVLA